MGDPTASEVQRELDRLRQDTHDDFVDLRAELAGFKARVVFSDVYASNQLRRSDQIAVLREAINRIEAARKAEQEKAEQERTQAQADRDKRAANRKWYIAALIIPIGGIVVELINVLRGVHW